MGRSREASGPPTQGRSRGAKVATAALLASLVVLGWQQTASAETGTQRFHITYAGPFDRTDPPERRVTAAGPIQGKGYEQLISEGPGPQPGTFQATTEFVFPEGSIFVTVTGTFELKFNPHACQGFNRVSGTWVITGGTDAYTGATGQGTVEGHNILFGEKTPDGCAPEPNRLVSNLRGVGTVTVASDQAA
jgi:hypothetical protein